MIAPELLNILCCPETRQNLRLASPENLATWQQLIDASQLKNRKGEIVKENFEAALIREDGLWAYIVRQGIPIMLIDEGIPV